MTAPLYGIAAAFDQPSTLLAAARAAAAAGWRDMEAFTPFPVEGLAEAIGIHQSPIAQLVFAGGVAGGMGGFLLQTFAMTTAYPFIVGGRPFFSWPSFIAVTFECTVLGAALTAVFGMLALNRLPEPYHPIFNTPGFRQASTDRFFLCLKASDPHFDRQSAETFLSGLRAEAISDVHT